MEISNQCVELQVGYFAWILVENEPVLARARDVIPEGSLVMVS